MPDRQVLKYQLHLLRIQDMIGDGKKEYRTPLQWAWLGIAEGDNPSC